MTDWTSYITTICDSESCNNIGVLPRKKVFWENPAITAGRVRSIHRPGFGAGDERLQIALAPGFDRV
jgi:hypothetical protein